MKNNGYIIIEVLISMALISIILIPLGKQTNQYIRLKKSSYRLKNLELLEMKLDVIKGYDKNLSEGKNIVLGFGIGTSDEEIKIILITEKNERIKKFLFLNK